MPYAATTQALSATTAQEIHGTEPYLTFDNGATRVTTTEGLLGITLSDGTRITPAINTSTATNPIVLPRAGDTLANVQMFVPTTTNSIALNALIGTPYNYWGDDDGDGQGTNGITATGNLTVTITDKNNQAVSRSAPLDLCNAPYKVELTSTSGSLTTQYGVPNSRSFSGSNVIYYINPKATPTILSADPGGTDPARNSPANIWISGKGFLVQSTTPSGYPGYSGNFPTTGFNNATFNLNICGGSGLTWPTVTEGGITATMTPDTSGNYVKVVLTGPEPTQSQLNSTLPGTLSTPNLPKTFELVGYDSSHRKVATYGFVLRQWFVKGKYDTIGIQERWCRSLGGGYRLTKIKDITNARCDCRGAVNATPASGKRYYNRNIGAGLLAEWSTGTMFGNTTQYCRLSDSGDYYIIKIRNGEISLGAGGPSGGVNDKYLSYCAYP
ncbi:hypothetical protein A9G13_02440 [Gilliamella sp. wkB178]|nr:hypothetical protein A9G13_02440 [Gilliamella apicola]